MRDRVRASLLELSRLAQFPADGGQPDASLGEQEIPHERFLQRIAAEQPEIIKEEAMRILESGLHGPLQRRCLLQWITGCGGETALEFLFGLLRDPHTQVVDRDILRDYFAIMLGSIHDHGFEPDLIRRFNQHISGFPGNGPVMHAYHEKLRDYCNWRFGTGLYERLERNGVQFWDYWLIYHPAS